MDENPSITLSFGEDDVKVKISFEFEENFPISENVFVTEIANMILEELG